MSEHSQEVPPHLSVGFADASAYSGMLLGAWLRARKERGRIEKSQEDVGLELLNMSYQDDYPPISLPVESGRHQSRIRGMPQQEVLADSDEKFQVLLERMHQEYKLRHSL